ncbi:MAG: outer membrane protein assembly factor BamD [Bacteroidota bacterium]|jgi:outer membrane protein assembly factor BamD
MKNSRALLLILMLSVVLASCSKFSRIKKSQDMEAKYKAAVEYYEKKNYYQALILFEELVSVFRGTIKAEDAYYYYSMCYYYTGEYTMAAYHFNNFSQTFPSSLKSEEAAFLNAYCYYLDSPVYSLDQKSTRDAIKQFQLFINRYPKSSKVAESNNLIDQLRAKLELKDFSNAKLYFKREQYKSAMIAFQNVIKAFPTTSYKEECLYYIVVSSYEYAGRSISSRQAERYKITIENHLKLVDAFPNGRFLKESEEIYQNCLKQLQKLGVS